MPTFYDRFVECAERWPDNVALEIQRRDRIESCTYAELHRMAESVGRWVTENGFARGSRLAIVADNHPRWVAAYLGIIAAGCAVVPFDTALHADQLTTLLKDSGTSALFCDAKHAQVARDAVASLNVGLVLMDPDRMAQHSASERWLANLPAILDGGPGKFQPAPAAADDLASLLYTSGTTADPKGVMLTHANFLGEVEAVFNWVDIGPSDALLGVLPMFHVLAQMANLLLPLVKGARVVYLETLNTTELLRALRERNITTFAVVPQFFYLIHDRIFQEVAKRGELAQRAFKALVAVNRTLRKVGLNAGPILFGKVHEAFGKKMRYLVTGGSRFDPQIAADFRDLGIDVLQAYGLTETTAAVFANSPTNNVIGSVGKAMKGVEAKIVYATTDPQREEDGPATGEICVRGAVVMKGYWNRPDATAAVLRDGWFYTGDLGYFDADGNLFLTGRKKEVIVLSNGKNIYPEEVEAHYVKSPYIKELAVMGLEGKPAEGGDRLHAVIVPNFDVLRQKKIVNAKEVIRFDIESLSQQIASTKRIGSYEIWQEDLPRTTTRKIKRFEVEKRAKANQARRPDDDAELPSERPLTADEMAWLDQPSVQRALNVVREAARTTPPALRPTLNLELDLGLDSMQRVELLSQIEEQLGGNVEESQLAGIYTVRELIDAVLQSAASGAGSPGTRASFAGWKAILAEEPSAADVVSLAQPKPFSDPFWYMVSRLIQVIALDRFDLHVRGVEKLPLSGAYILSSNHQSYLDPVILASILPPEVFHKVFAVGTSEIFGKGFMLRLARSLRVVVVDPDANLIPAMRAGAFGLRQGRPLILYPEGERSIDGTPRTFKKGAAILSIHLQVPIVPIAIEGFYEVWPRNKPFRGFKPLKMVFGDPILPPPESEASEAAYEKLTAELRARVVGMWEELRNKASDEK
ncbi:MAG: AMP-binding protein [Candidatus Sulfotelmatobacter sp.]|jgi:long-chain acyl-CoA synthetase